MICSLRVEGCDVYLPSSPAISLHEFHFIVVSTSFLSGFHCCFLLRFGAVFPISFQDLYLQKNWSDCGCSFSHVTQQEIELHWLVEKSLTTHSYEFHRAAERYASLYSKMPPRSPPWESKHSHHASASYLASLRNDRPTRPTGSRPPPFKSGSHVSSMRAAFDRSDSAPIPHQSTNTLSEHPGIVKSSSFSSNSPTKGRPLAHAPHSSISSVHGRNISPPTSLRSLTSPETEYQESTRRKLEREESHTLREALDLIDGHDEETAIYTAAQQEAADLVWKHRNPQAAEDEKTAPYFNPDAQKRKSYGNDLGNKTGSAVRNASDSSTGSSDSAKTGRSSSGPRRHDRALSQALKHLQLASAERAAAIVSTTTHGRRRSSGQRIVSNGSSKGVFRNPEDQIYEEPEPLNTPNHDPPVSDHALQSKTRNSILRGARPLPQKPGVTFAADQPRFNRIDIYKNPPSQSRNAGYTANGERANSTSTEPDDIPKSSDGIEIRGEDIRAATSMKLKDRSAKLPTPVAVSDHVGRPIVSFDPAWKPPSDSPRSSIDTGRPVIKLTESPRNSRDIGRPLPRPLPSTHQTINSAPVVPTINLPDDENDGVPSIRIDSVDAPSVSVAPPIINVSGPSINVSGPEHAVPKSTPVPRPLPRHAATTPTGAGMNKRLPWLRSGMPTAPAVACSSCELPISGRIVTASGSSSGALKARLHPECFSCYHCQTNLECIAFFPEPDAHRCKRLEAEGLAETDEGDIRFFCSLDYHELFSPRCKSCKTPIEGEVIVAAGAEWHVGHFFCAECGDPFDSNTPFVEKDGYAYCVRCHTKRTSARCRECKQQILDELTVEALGGKWHEECFRCYECRGSFGDNGQFFIRDVAVEPSDKERRKGITRKMEEKAVCSGCEERRLKA
jgi:hypothetical protein